MTAAGVDGPLLDIQSIAKSFGGFTVLEDVSLAVERGSTVGVLGPNGAGKSTLTNCVTGIYPPTTGAILLAGERIDKMPPHKIAARGVGRTFQTVEHFNSLTVMDLVLLGRNTAFGYGFFEALLRLPRARRQEREERRFATGLLEKVGLEDVVDSPLEELPYAYRKLADLARALAGQPRMLLLDEPGAGLDKADKRQLIQRLKDVRAEGVEAILLIEHDVGFVREACEKVVFLNFGRVLQQGTPAEVLAHPEVRMAYLGEGVDAGLDATVPASQ